MSWIQDRLRLSLSQRLLIGTLALLAVVGGVVGTASVAIVHNSLVAQVDAELQSALTRGQGGFDGDHDHDGAVGGGSVDGALRVPGQAAGTVSAVRSASGLVAAMITPSGRLAVLSTQQAAPLADVDRLETVELPLLGSYRALAVATASGQRIIVAVPLAAADSTAAELAWSVAFVVFVALVVAAVAGSWMVRRSLRPLTEVTQTARAVSELDLERGEVALHVRVPEQDERTEVGQLGAAFNRMLGHVSQALDAREQSEQKVRQFVADASHELRTPLASIRGYAELTRLSPDPLPTDAAHALGRIEAESVRMTELVDDLLLLARLDEGRELSLKPSELGVVLDEIVADARVAGPAHEFSCELPSEPLNVIADEPRLRQVFVNLVANARVHTPEGTRVQVRASERDRMVMVEVEDSGPGIDPAVRDTLFERFARADSSRSRAAGSTGLGLAIAAAVVRAHHGEISVESAPGRTVFRVTLPSAPSVA